MNRKAVTHAGFAMVLALALVAWVVPAAGQKLVVPPGKSAAAAKELGTLLDEKKWTNIAAADPATPNRYVTAFYASGVQIMLVAAVFEGTDIDYYLYQRDYASAFSALKASTTTKDRFFVEDITANGLVAQPPKGAVADIVTSGATKRTLDGDFSDTRVVNRSKISFEDYCKTFAELDDKYAQALGVLVTALKK